MITEALAHSIQESVLCWLATVGADGYPNVSPKEVFCAFGSDELLIANIASPRSVKNLLAHPKVCVSFVHVFRQKGFKVKGTAIYLRTGDAGYTPRHDALKVIAGEAYPIKGVIAVKIERVDRILAPSYLLYPEEGEAEKIAAAKRTYGVG
ncbi:MAG: pyridoxamine 5'-phosphate oxidase family protein [Bacteroidota bacterium]